MIVSARESVLPFSLGDTELVREILQPFHGVGGLIPSWAPLAKLVFSVFFLEKSHPEKSNV